jgi:hypothetical protein
VSVQAVANFVSGTYNVDVTVDDVPIAGSFALTNLADVPAAIRVIDGSDRQAAKVGTPFARPLTAKVVDAYENPVPNVKVSILVPGTQPSATLGASAATTDAKGSVSFSATAGPTAGAYLATAVVEGTAFKADYALENTTLSPVVVRTESGSPQSATVDKAFGARLVVVVTRDNQPLANTAVSFAAPSQGPTAKLSALSVTTDNSGHADVGAIAGTKAGLADVLAFVPNGEQPAHFALTSTAGAAAKVTADALSTPQNAQSGTSFASPLRVLVTDAFGNPVSGATVTFTAPTTAPSAALGQTSVVSDASGYATTTAGALGTAGTYTVTASAAGATGNATFDLGNLTTAPVYLTAAGGTRQSAEILKAFGQPLLAKVTDAAGAVIVGNRVTFRVAAAGGPSATLGSTFALSVAGTGEASVNATANDKTGSHDAFASATDGASPVRFLLANTQAKVATLRVGDGASPQKAFLGNFYPQKLRVLAVDGSGNPVRGVVLTLTPPSSGPSASLSSVSPATDMNGAVEVFGLAAVAAGTFTLPVTAPQVAAVTLNLENLTPPAPASPAAPGAAAAPQTTVDNGSLEGGGLSCAVRKGRLGTGGRGTMFGLAALIGLVAAVRRKRTRS